MWYIRNITPRLPEPVIPARAHTTRRPVLKDNTKTQRTSSVLPGLGLKGPIIAIGDTHFPFTNRPWMKWVIKRVKEVQPAYVVQVGDVYDYFSLSAYAKTADCMTPAAEFEAGRRMAEDMWTDVHAAAPRAELLQKLGNHDARASKRLFEKLPEIRSLVDLESPFNFKGVTTEHDDTAETMIGNVFVIHGYKSFGAHARHNQGPTITGHLHRGGVAYFQNRFGYYWELNAGFGADIDSVAMRYRHQKKIHGWTLGLGEVDEQGPRFSLFPG